jgi:hypothetical protein
LPNGYSFRQWPKQSRKIGGRDGSLSAKAAAHTVTKEIAAISDLFEPRWLHLVDIEWKPLRVSGEEFGIHPVSVPPLSISVIGRPRDGVRRVIVGSGHERKGHFIGIEIQAEQ